MKAKSVQQLVVSLTAGCLFIPCFAHAQVPHQPREVHRQPITIANENLAARSKVKLGDPTSVAITRDDRVFVLDRTNNAVLEWEVNRGILQAAIPKEGQEVNVLLNPIAITPGNSGDLYILDENGTSVKVFSPGGDLLTAFPLKTVAASIAVGAAGEIYINTYLRPHIITVYDRAGHEVCSFGKTSDGFPSAGAFRMGLLAIDGDGSIYFLSKLLPLLKKFDANGTELFEKDLRAPEATEILAIDQKNKRYQTISKNRVESIVYFGGLAGDGRGALYALVGASSVVYKLSSSGDLVEKIHLQDATSNKVNVRSIALDSQNRFIAVQSSIGKVLLKF